MAQLHERVRSLNSSDNDQVKETLAQFFHKLARATDSDHSQWLNTIELILNRFPKSCLQHRSTIETYLVQFLDSEHECWVVGAAKCCHALQQVRALNDKSATAKSSWRQQMTLLCSTAHDLMGAAFSDAVDIYKATGYFQKSIAEENPAVSTVMGAALSQLSVASRDFGALAPAERTTLLFSRLKNVFTFVQAMLVEVYPAAKAVRAQAVLDVVVRALSVSVGGGGAGGTRDVAVARVKAHALRTLDALVLCLGSNLMPYSPLLFRLITQTLRWCAGCADHHSQESQNIRGSCYESLGLWLSSLQCHKLEGEAARGRGVSLEEELLTELLGDVAPRTQLVQLTMSNQFTKNLSKKAKRKMANTMLSQSGIAHHIPGEKNKEITSFEDPQVVLAALHCLEVLLTTSGIFLKPASHKKVQECLVRQCYSVSPEEASSSRGLALCRALEASRLAAPASLAPPTHHCLAIYSRLHTATDARLAQFCSGALLAVRSALHSAPATLSLAPVPPPRPAGPPCPDLAATTRNRAALAALLGDHKLPPPKQSEEIITLLDDALNPNRKTEDNDQISVSSQSSNVVEIDESNGVDLDSPGTNFEDPIEVDEIDFIPEPSVSNGKMKLSDFDDKEKDVLIQGGAIHELPTQIPHNASNDSVAIANDEMDSDCVEVSYNHSGEMEDNIQFLEKLEGDHLPSTGDTDDIQITCGQTLKSSQESGIEKTNLGIPTKRESPLNITDPILVEASKTNVIEDIKKLEKIGTLESVATCMNAVVSAQDGAVNVDDMLADFVDEKADG